MVGRWTLSQVCKLWTQDVWLLWKSYSRNLTDNYCCYMRCELFMLRLWDLRQYLCFPLQSNRRQILKVAAFFILPLIMWLFFNFVFLPVLDIHMYIWHILKITCCKNVQSYSSILIDFETLSYLFRYTNILSLSAQITFIITR